MCGCSLGSGVAIRSKASDDGNATWYSADGAGVCGSVWVCPVCSAVVGYRRGREIERVLDEVKAAGGGGLFLTLTVPHVASDELRKLLGVVADGWRRMVSGSPWLRFKDRIGLEGVVRAVEVTCGCANGWHAHLHVLIVLDHPPEHEDIVAAHAFFRGRWSRWVVKMLDGRVVHDRHGVDVRAVTGSTLSDYLCKVEGGRASFELTRGDMKTARNGGNYQPFELLALADQAEDPGLRRWASERFHEYAWATKGRRRLTWSRGLKQRYQADTETDEELAQAAVDGDLETIIEHTLWNDLLRDRRGVIGHALISGESGGLAAFLATLRGYGYDLSQGWRDVPVDMSLDPPEPEPPPQTTPVLVIGYVTGHACAA